MGFISDIFGAKDEYKATPVPVLQGVTPDQTNQVYAQGQGLTGRQTSVADQLLYRAQRNNPLNFGAANTSLGAAGQSLGGAGATVQTGNELLGQLMAQGRGEGPNPALAQLQQTTAANINNAAGMAASARGINPALAARMAVNTAAGANQGAAGQAAIMTAQQQLAARAQAAGLVGQQIAGQTGIAGMQAGIAGQQAGQAQAQASQETQNWQQLMAQLGTMGGQNLTQQQILQGALANYNQANIGQNLGVQGINAGVAAQNAQTGRAIMGGIFQGAGVAAAKGAGAAAGGEVTPAGVRGPQSEKDVARAILGRNGRKLASGGEARGKRSDKDVARAILFGKGGNVPGLAEGGAAEQPGESGGLAQAIADWWHKRSEPASREVAEQINRKLPEAVSAAPAVQKHRGDLETAYQAAQGKAHGGKVSRDKEVAAQILMHRYFGGGRAGGYAPGGTVGNFLAGVGRTLAPDWAPPRLPPAPTVSPPPAPAPAADPNTPSSFIGRMFQGMGTSLQRPGFARGGATHPLFLSHGVPEVVPGRASVPEGVDSETADRVPAWLTPGEGVLPRSVMQAPDAPERAASFVEHLVRSRGKNGGYRRVVAARKRLQETA